MIMSSREALQLHLDSGHCRAICDEIGDRLRIVLNREASALPQRLQMLVDRLAELDREQAPSIVPAMDDMVVWSTAAA
jgi:hypothetical protein